ncbi:MAG: hypothetical protein Q8S42_00865 [Archangium sp.]|nr:hypothetical protein [Archangium sp.]
MRIGRWISSLFRRPVPPAPRTPSTPAPTTPAPTPTPTRPVDTFEPGAPMRVSLGKVTGYSAAERQKLDKATQLMGNVLNSQEFRDAVLSADFAGKPGFASETRSPQDVYAAIRAAKENYTDAADGEVDLNVKLENMSWFQRNVVGYTTESSDTLTTNRRFFSGFEPSEMAGHLAHEWLHKLGFEHDFKATARRPDSVPYELGDLVERLARGPLTPLA